MFISSWGSCLPLRRKQTCRNKHLWHPLDLESSSISPVSSIQHTSTNQTNQLSLSPCFTMVSPPPEKSWKTIPTFAKCLAKSPEVLWSNSSPKVKLCNVGGQCISSMGWLNFSPKIKVFNSGGHVTSVTLLTFWRFLGWIPYSFQEMVCCQNVYFNRFFMEKTSRFMNGGVFYYTKISHIGGVKGV